MAAGAIPRKEQNCITDLHWRFWVKRVAASIHLSGEWGSLVDHTSQLIVHLSPASVRLYIYSVVASGNVALQSEDSSTSEEACEHCLICFLQWKKTSKSCSKVTQCTVVCAKSLMCHRCKLVMYEVAQSVQVKLGAFFRNRYSNFSWTVSQTEANLKGGTLT